MTKSFFVTATGTDIGKTLATAALVHQLRASKKTVTAVKPIACGEPQDTKILMQALGEKDFQKISPFHFKEPISPHLAAAREKKKISLREVVKASQPNQKTDYHFIEGVGGMMVPLTEKETVLDWIKATKYPVILVAGTYLGSFNHTLMSIKILEKEKIKLRAVIISESTESAASRDEMINTIKAHTRAQCLYIPRIKKRPAWKYAPDLLSVL